MSKYEIISIGGCEDYNIRVENINIDDVRDLDDYMLMVVGGVCCLVNCCGLSDNDVERLEKENELFGIVNDFMDEGSKKEGWLMVEDGNDVENDLWDLFVKVYGESKCISWGIEYDENVSVMLKGNWFVLREEVKKEMKRRERLEEERLKGDGRNCCCKCKCCCCKCC
jgi:hypothetical protein